MQNMAFWKVKGHLLYGNYCTAHIWDVANVPRGCCFLLPIE